MGDDEVRLRVVDRHLIDQKRVGVLHLGLGGVVITRVEDKGDSGFGRQPVVRPVAGMIGTVVEVAQVAFERPHPAALKLRLDTL